MQPTWKDIVESKKFWYALLSVAAFFAGRYGLALDVTGTLALMAPFMGLLGAQGWADSGTGGSAMQKRAMLATPPVAVVAVPSLAAVPDGAQKGSIRLGTLLAMSGAVTLVATMLAGCPGGGARVGGAAGAAEGCALRDAAGVVTDVVAALAKEDWQGALAVVKDTRRLEQDALDCAVATTLAALSSGAPKTSEPTPVVLHARAYLDSRKK